MLLVPLALAGCGGVLGEPEGPGEQSAVQAPSEPPMPVASGPRVQADGAANVLTGEPAPDGRVLAVTIDDTAAALPQAGLNQADLVYVAEGEGGSTRLLAVFQTELPSRIGPVGSARSSDVGILGNHGPVALAVVEADGEVLRELEEADLQPVSLSTGPEGFTRDPDREAPHDVVGDGAALLARVPGSAVARDVGLRFGPVGEGSPTASAGYPWSGSTVEFAWSADDDAWVHRRDGEPAVDEAGDPVRADNVLFMEVDVVDTEDLDADGARIPEVRPVGSGDVTLLRDGVAVTGSWSRAAVPEPTRFADAAGEDLLLDVGTTWVVLVGEGESATLTAG